MVSKTLAFRRQALLSSIVAMAASRVQLLLLACLLGLLLAVAPAGECIAESRDQ
jgi:hypothetical protein